MDYYEGRSNTLVSVYLIVAAYRVFDRNEKRVKDWLYTPHPFLDGKLPIDVACKEPLIAYKLLCMLRKCNA